MVQKPKIDHYLNSYTSRTDSFKTTIPRNAGNHSSLDAVSHPRRPESSITPPSNPDTCTAHKIQLHSHVCCFTLSGNSTSTFRQLKVHLLRYAHFFTTAHIRPVLLIRTHGKSTMDSRLGRRQAHCVTRVQTDGGSTQWAFRRGYRVHLAAH